MRKLSRRCPDNAGYLDRDLGLTELRERIVVAGVIVQRSGTAIRREIVGAEPVLTQDDGIHGKAADMFDEAGEMEGDLGVGYLIR